MIYKNLVQKISIPADRKTKQKDYLLAGQLPIIDQGKKLIGGYSNDLTKTISCDLPVIVFGDHTKVVKYISFPFGAGADGIKILKPKENIFPKYLYYATQYLTLKMEDKGYARHYQHLEKKDLSVPPLEEQQRIVARIEELFSELDAAVATLERTKEQLAVYRQAVLKEAFSPKDNWSVKKVSEIGEVCLGRQRSPKNVSKDYPTKYLRAANITETGIDLTDVLEMEFSPKERTKYYLQYNDIILSEASGSAKQVGKPGLWKCQIQDCCIQNTVIRHRVKADNPEYVYWYYKYLYISGFFSNIVGGVGINHLGAKNFAEIRINLAPVSDQEGIVSDIESRLSVCDKIEETVITALQEAEAMRQSILKQAFAGEL